MKCQYIFILLRTFPVNTCYQVISKLFQSYKKVTKVHKSLYLQLLKHCLMLSCSLSPDILLVPSWSLVLLVLLCDLVNRVALLFYYGDPGFQKQAPPSEPSGLASHSKLSRSLSKAEARIKLSTNHLWGPYIRGWIAVCCWCMLRAPGCSRLLCTPVKKKKKKKKAKV